MSIYKLTIFTRYSLSVEIEAENKEEAEEILWELYNTGEHDPVDNMDADVETNIEYDGIA